MTEDPAAPRPGPSPADDASRAGLLADILRRAGDLGAEHAGAEAGDLWGRIQRTRAAKELLLAALVAAPADDDLLLWRHRLDAAREAWKVALLRRVTHDAAPWPDDASIAAWSRASGCTDASGDEAPPAPGAGPGAELASLQPAVEDLLLLEMVMRLGHGASPLLVAARGRLEARRRALATRDRAASEGALRVLAADLADRAEQARGAPAAWLLLLESETLQLLVAGESGVPSSTLFSAELRLGWLAWRCGADPALESGIVAAERDLAARRLEAAGRALAELEAGPGAAAEAQWGVLQAASEALASATRFGWGAGRADQASVRAGIADLRQRLREDARSTAAVAQAPARWCATIEGRTQALLAEAEFRPAAWGAEALGELRSDAEWLEAAAATGRPAPPTAEPAARIGRLAREVREEHRDVLLRSRLERLFGRRGAATLDLLVVGTVLLLLGVLTARLLLPLPAEFDPPLDHLDGLLSLVLLFEFTLKLGLSESARDYLRRRWFTDLLPSLPLVGLVEAAGTWLAVVPPLGLVRALGVVRLVRLVSFVQRGCDRLARRARGLLDVTLTVFGEAADAAAAAGAEDVAGLLAARLRHTSQVALDEAARGVEAEPEPSVRSAFLHQALAEVRARIAAADDAALQASRGAAHRRRTELRLEEAIDRLKGLEAVRVVQVIGERNAAQVASYLRVAGPLLLPLAGMSWRDLLLPPAELVARLGRRVALLLDLLLVRGVNWFRDLFGIVGAAELFSFVGAFLARVFRRHQNRLVLGVLVLLVGLVMIKANEDDNVWRVSARLELAEPADFSRVVERLDAIGSPFGARATLDAATTSTTLVLRSEVAMRRFRSERTAALRLREDLERLVPAGARSVSEPDIDTVAEPAVMVTVGRALQRSFGAVLIILGLVGFVAVAFGNWLTRRAGQLVDHSLRVAEAQFINLMKDRKRRTAARDLEFLHRRVVRPELRGIEAVPGRDAALFDSLCEQAERACALFLDGTPHQRAPDPLDATIDRVVTLYRDYLDGGVLHRSDLKTTEQLLGNTAMLEVIDRLGLPPRERRRLERLDLAKARSLFGPFLWFVFVTNAIAQRVGALVLEFNRRHATSDFDALHFLDPLPARDALVRRRHGEAALEELRRERRAVIRSVFGTYPVAPRRLNPYRLYRTRYAGGVRIVRLPWDMAMLALRAASWLCGRFAGLFREFLGGGAGRGGRPTYAGPGVAHRKIFRLRRPVVLAALRLRARFDLAYLDLLPRGLDYRGCEGSTVDDDLDALRASPHLRIEVEALRAEVRRRLLVAEAFLDGRDREEVARLLPDDRARRAALTAVALNEGDLADLADVALRIDRLEREVLRSEGWPPGWRRLRRALAEGVARCRAAGNGGQSPEQAVAHVWLAARGWIRPEPEVVRAIARAWRLDARGWRGAVRLLIRHDAVEDPAGAVMRRLAAAASEAARLEAQLATLRAVQTLSLLDLRNDRDLVEQIGAFDQPFEGRLPAGGAQPSR